MDKRKEDLVVGDVVYYHGWHEVTRYVSSPYLVIIAVDNNKFFDTKDLFSNKEVNVGFAKPWTYLCHINDFGSV